MALHSSLPRKIGYGTVFALVLLAPFVSRANGADIDRAAVNRARDFLETERRGKFIMPYLHFGSTYDGHEAKEVVPVKNPAGNIVPGHFALIYEFDWDGDGWTTVAFFFDEKGTFYELKALKTNAVFNQPFLKANVSIAILGNALLEAFRKDMNAEQLRQAQRFIDNADAKDLLEMALALQQKLGT